MNRSLFSGEDEDILAMVQFHMVSAVSLMRIILDNGLLEKDMFRSVLEEMAKNSLCVREEALWETYKDFLDEDIDRALASVTPISEGEEL
jgi:hypothetical protein